MLSSQPPHSFRCASGSSAAAFCLGDSLFIQRWSRLSCGIATDSAAMEYQLINLKSVRRFATLRLVLLAFLRGASRFTTAQLIRSPLCTEHSLKLNIRRRSLIGAYEHMEIVAQ